MARETTSQSKATAQPGRTRDTQPQRGGANGGSDREQGIRTAREGTQQGRMQVAQPNRVREGGRMDPGRWMSDDPFVVMQRMAEDMEQLMDEFGLGRLGMRPRVHAVLPTQSPRAGSLGSTAWSPQIEVSQREDRLIVRADLPGVKREDVHVDIANDMLTIRGERREEREQDEEGIYRSERMYGQFSRAIPLPDGVDPDACEATYKDGVLQVTIPTPTQSRKRSRRIAVK